VFSSNNEGVGKKVKIPLDGLPGGTPNPWDIVPRAFDLREGFSL